MSERASEREHDGEHGDDRFAADWLALRERADARARNAALLARLLAALGRDVDAPAANAEARGDRSGESGGARARAHAGTLRVLDLGAGTGANLRYLAPRLGRGQRWTLLDHDATLLGRLEARLESWLGPNRARLERDGDALAIRADAFDARVERRVLDLAGELDALPVAESDLVTCSALLDLAGGAWLDALAERCARHRCAVLFALSVDGRLSLDPALDDDAAIVERFERHQRQEKGLGVALGPDAADRLAESLAAHGLDVTTAASDWQLEAGDAADAALQRELLSGIARAVSEADASFADRAARWLAARRATIDAGGLTLHVGHLDLLGLARG